MATPSLPTRQLGKDGPQVTALGFGLMGLSIFYGTRGSDEERLAFLDKVYASGERFWDSADVYGDSEDLVGKWFARTNKRKDIFLATKFANQRTPDGKSATVNNDPAYIREACDKSLKRLGLGPDDSIDLYYCHRIDPSRPIETTVETMVELKNQGKIKYLGLSECSAETLRRACAVHHIAAVQVEYSPFSMDIEHPQVELLKTCRELGVAVVAYSPLSRGFLTGTLRSHDDFPEDDRRRIMPRFNKDNFANNLKLVDKLTELAKKRGVTSSQLTLAWLMAQGDDIIPIPGTTKEKNFQDNLASLDIKISPEEDREIRSAIDQAEVVGDRYPASMLGNLLADTVPPKQ